MLVQASPSMISSRIFILTLVVATIALLLSPPSRAQQVAPKTAPATTSQGSIPQKASPATEGRAETDDFVACTTTWGELMFRLKATAEGKSPGPLFSSTGMAY
jgi:hypothetical protein